MDTVKVYRVAHRDLNIGPWNIWRLAKRKEEIYKAIPEADIDAIRRLFRLMSSLEMDMQVHITIRDDVGWCCWSFCSDFLCATSSIEDLKFWFFDKDIIDALFDANFIIFEMVLSAEDIL